MKLSTLATQYLATLERQHSVSDRALLENAFHKAGIPVLEPVIDFQITFGGYVQWHGLNQFIWGIIHERPDEDSGLEPNKLSVENDDEEIGNFFITCANCHRSDDWFLDARGALYWCFAPPLATSFATKIERDAVGWNLTKGPLHRIVSAVPSEEFITLIIPRIEAGRIAEASDDYESLYLYQGVYAAVKNDRIQAFLVNEGGRSLLEDLPVSVEG